MTQTPNRNDEDCSRNLNKIPKIEAFPRTFKEMWNATPETHRGPGWFIPNDQYLRESFPIVVQCPGCRLPAPVSVRTMRTDLWGWNIIQSTTFPEDTLVCVNHQPCWQHSVCRLDGWNKTHDTLIGFITKRKAATLRRSKAVPPDLLPD